MTDPLSQFMASGELSASALFWLLDSFATPFLKAIGGSWQDNRARARWDDALQSYGQSILRLLIRFCKQFAPATVLPSGLRVRLWSGKFREPDVVLMLAAHDNRRGEEYWEVADLVVEVVSDSVKE